MQSVLANRPSMTTIPKREFWDCSMKRLRKATHNGMAGCWRKRYPISAKISDICLERRRSWCISTDPEFGPKAADIVGLYLNPPENALVIAVDEKPSMQALERAQGYLRLPDGKALNGRSHGYKRHGTTTLFAAFDMLPDKSLRAITTDGGEESFWTS